MPETEWTKAVAETWNSLADVYDAVAETEQDRYRTVVMGPGLMRAIGAVKGLRVLDLGCGQGYFSRVLARAGAAVVGADISTGQISHARRREVVSCIALQDMPDPVRVLTAARTVLTAAGRAVVLVTHPTNESAHREWEVDAAGRKVALRIDRYFETGPKQATWKVTYEGTRRVFQFPTWARTLEEWSGVIAEAGFLIAGLREPRPSPEEIARVPELEDCARIPYFLVFDLVPDPRQGAL